MDLWYYRAFVARAHRKSNVAATLAMTGRTTRGRLRQRRGHACGGAIYEVENEGLKRHFDDALPTDFTFLGENQRGDHVRVHYFPGALAHRSCEGHALNRSADSRAEGAMPEAEKPEPRHRQRRSARPPIA
jgi:hypothetical protein